MAKAAAAWRYGWPALAGRGAAIPRLAGIPLGVAGRRSPADRICRLCRAVWPGSRDQPGCDLGVRPVLGGPCPGVTVVRAGVAAAQPDQNGPPGDRPGAQDSTRAGAVPLSALARLLARGSLSLLV